MKPFATPFEPVGVARNYDEMQALLREIADTSGKSREQIDRDGGLPDRYASKALASVPIGTCQLGARTLEKALKGVGAVLIVARITPALNRAADSGVKRREEQVRTKLLSMEVFNAAKALLARQNGKLGGKAYREKVPLWKRRAIARKGARIRRQNARLKGLKPGENDGNRSVGKDRTASAQYPGNGHRGDRRKPIDLPPLERKGQKADARQADEKGHPRQGR